MKNKLRKIKGMTGVAFSQFMDENEGFQSPLTAALENPDVLSDESAMFPPRDHDEEAQRAAYMAKFVKALETLTDKQRAVIDALQKYGDQQKAADALGITRSTLSVTLLYVQKKIEKAISKMDKGE